MKDKGQSRKTAEERSKPRVQILKTIDKLLFVSGDLHIFKVTQHLGDLFSPSNRRKNSVVQTELNHGKNTKRMK